ncbi:fucolectin-1-like isoform X2 [Trachinotus anak]|uniref:fucolectin-1-like isoform X2 n=1 Tax=Trachinotus anak TaxID=443729 RepID=UPI0039F1DD1E
MLLFSYTVKMLWTLLLSSLITGTHLNDTVVCNNTASEVLNGTTSQSSNYTNGIVPYSSDRAIDGNKSLCAHSSNDLNSQWWRIDLLGVYNISCIAIYNVKQDNTIMNGAVIHIGSSRGKNGTDNPILSEYNCFDFPGDVLGRYITVSLPQKKHLILCEVKIWGSLIESPFILIEKNMTWEDALYHCRDHYSDLASILSPEDQAWAELEARNATTPYVWLGLHYTCTLGFWFWVEDCAFGYKHWAPDVEKEECDMSVAMKTKEEHFWYRKSDNHTFNFICRK